MKLNFRDLKQQKFTIDAEPSDTVLQVKERIAEEKGWEASSQKLIYSGKILADANTVESYKIEEKGFIVCMVSKPKAAPAPKPAPVPATPQAAPSTPAQPPAPQAASNTTASTAQNPPATPSPAQSQQVPTEPGFGDASAMLVGNRSETAIREMEAMGFERPDIERALRAAFYNPDRAIDYLLNGIPENIQAEQRQAQQQREQQAQAAAAGPGAGQAPTQQAATTPSAGQTAVAPEPEQPGEVNLFEAAAQAGQRGGATRGAGGQGLGAAGLGAGAGAGAAAGAGAGQGGEAVNIDFLRNSQHFQQLRRLVQQEPAMLEPILQQVAEGNPQLAQLIGQNPETFLQLLSEDLTGEGGGEGGLGAHQISVTPEEADAIERLCGLGFPRQRVIQAYFACDKNEELAANFLFEQPDDDE